MKSATWLEKWTPEDETFWNETGSKIAWRTLTVTTITLILSFATWFMMSAIVVKLPGIGFNFTTTQLFWLAAMPGLAGGTLRIFHTFLVPIVGTRHIVTFATFIKILPCIGIGLAVMDPNTPFWVFMILAFTAVLVPAIFRRICLRRACFFPNDCRERRSEFKPESEILVSASRNLSHRSDRRRNGRRTAGISKN